MKTSAKLTLWIITSALITSSTLALAMFKVPVRTRIITAYYCPAYHEDPEYYCLYVRHLTVFGSTVGEDDRVECDRAAWEANSK